MSASSAASGLLSVWNGIDAADEDEFNAWYQGEHLAERLALPGILSARRYAEIGVPHSYAAIYDTAGLAPLGSPEYLERLANPTPRTRAIMPRFRNMVRAASDVLRDIGERDAKPGAVLACLELRGPGVSALTLKALEKIGPGLISTTGVRRIRLADPNENATRVPNPEAKLRAKPDALPAPFLLVEGKAEKAVRAAAAALGKALGAPRPARIYSLIEARTK
jgi:hypothetical protein